MDLSFLIPSKIRRLVLAYFVENPKAQVGVRELARELSASPQQTYRELVNLEGWGFLFSSRRGNQRAFRVNERFVLYPPLASLFEQFRQSSNLVPTISKVLDWKRLSKGYRKINIPQQILDGLQAKRVQPRSFTEENMLQKRGLIR